MKNWQKFILLVIASIIVISLFVTIQLPKKDRVLILFPDKKVTISAEVADTQHLQNKGLMNRTYLPDGKGMFFIFETSGDRRFWMKNTLIPLDMLFISENYTIVNISANAQPCISEPCKNYNSVVPAKYVLEVNAGFAEKNGIRIGDSVLLR